ncbi:condensation domain-containing protein [Amycolatopsis sp. PS_44_ISF1]|uniref:condensation domain-containing protein n=1 Tax=Amycolatopsis sp. PS_44_ISF1 TaxID=2974917 RepID=UPI0028E052BD|nr:condensation domain-containing protein [Amycolatopsis sp. PS_44_ISF1]MDT8912282.1 condensation domain-containing protein [Amycolatopsis sp. PS_44_ISF1]
MAGAPEIPAQSCAAPGEGHPVSQGQRRCAERDAQLSNRSVLNVALRIDITGPLDPAALAAAVSSLVERRHVLRTRFRRDSSGFTQDVGPAAPVELPVADLSPGDDAAVSAWCYEQALPPFDLSGGEVARFALALAGADRWVLTFVQHHIITDATSLSILMADLAAGYRAAVSGTAGHREEPVQFAEFVRWEREHLAGAAGKRSIEFWRAELEGATVSLPLPGDRPRPPVLSGHGALQPFDVEPGLARRLAQWAEAHRVTLYAVLLTAFGQLLRGLVGRREVTVVGAFPNRTRQRFENLAGPLTNSLALRLPGDPGGTIREAVSGIAHRLWTVADHVGVPFSVVLDEARVRERPGAEHFPQVWFSLHPDPGRRLDLPGLRAVAEEIAIPGVRSDLGVLAVPGVDGVRLWVESADYLDPPTVTRWMADYERLLRRLVDDPATPLRAW